MVPSYEEVKNDKALYAKCFKILSEQQDPTGKDHRAASATPFGSESSDFPLNTEQMDAVYELPYTGTYHPMYESQGGIPALQEVKFSITSSRGCYGSCSFCALTFHQGRIVSARSHESVLREAERMTKDPDFKGYIHDVGGATANFRGPACKKQTKSGTCIDKSCLYPTVCKAIDRIIRTI